MRSDLPSPSRDRQIIESITEFALIVTDRDGIITEWNPGAEHILGWSAVEMVGQPAEVFFTFEDRERGQARIEMLTALETGRGIDERWHVKKDGARFWASGEVMPLTGADGDVEGFIKILRDRTEQRNAGLKYRADAEFMRSVMASSADCIKVLDLDAKITFLNEGGMKAMEVSDFNDVKGCPWPDFWHGQGNIDAVAALEKARAGGVGHFVGIANTYLGTPRWWDVQVTPIAGPDGSPEKLLAVSRDITGQKAAETQLAASEARWHGLFNSMQEGFFLGELIRNADGRPVDARFLEINRAFARQSGLPADSVGRTIRELLPAIDQSLIDNYASTVETGKPIAFEIDVPELGRHFDVRASKEEGERFSALFLDVSARRQAEMRRAAMNELGDHLRDADTVLDMTTKAAEIVGKALRGSRAGYGEMDEACENVTILRDGSAPGEVSIVGRHSFESYGAVAPNIGSGEPVIIHDVATDPRTAAFPETFAAINVKAMLNVPVQERGRFAGLIFVHSPVERIWTPEEVAFARNVADRVQAGIARLRAEERKTILNRELSHRIKNTLAIVQSIASQTLRSAPDMASARNSLTQRIQALAKAHEILVTGHHDSGSVDAIIRSAISLHDPEGRIALHGPNVTVGPKAALTLALVMHELATNAAKYGSLSVPEGHVSIDWLVQTSLAPEMPTLVLTWREIHGPPASPPTRTGFGTRLIEMGLSGSVGGSVALDYAPGGLRCRIIASLTELQADDAE